MSESPLAGRIAEECVVTDPAERLLLARENHRADARARIVPMRRRTLKHPKAIALSSVVVTTTLVGPATVLAQADPGPPPAADPITIDGELGAEEWSDARRAGTAAVEVSLSRAEGLLQVGLRTDPLLVASLCIAAGDTVHVFHSSSALGHIAYVREANDWRLTGSFEWRMRRTDLGPEATGERREHLRAFGWIANTSAMGAPGETEFRIGRDLEADPDARLALGLLLAGDDPAVAGWPPGPGEDGCTLRSTIAGPPPERASFDPSRWLPLSPTEPPPP